MHALVDIAHPAHVHFYRNIIRLLIDGDHTVTVASRDKDVTNRLLREYGIPFQSLSSPSTRRIGQASELVTRSLSIARLAHQVGASVILTRNPAGVLASRLAGIKSVFDTDDGHAIGLHHTLAATFATRITCPDALGSEAGSRHDLYPSYKALAYLHPNQFTPNPAILHEYDIRDRPFFVVRCVSMTASHDRGEHGLSLATLRRVVSDLRAFGHVFISSEGQLPDDLRPYAVLIKPSRLHDLLAFAHLYIGDSQTMAFEAGLLGVPALHTSSWSGRLPALVELEQRFGLVQSYRPSETPQLVADARRMAIDPAIRPSWQARRSRMLKERVDLSSWYVKYLATTFS